jgi:membrane protein implicated in regulation of membrane protease activity
VAFEYQLLVFALFAVVSVGLSRVYLRQRPIETDDPTLNRRAEQYVGRTFTLEEPIRNGRGKVRVGDSTWVVEGRQDLPAGGQVRVTGVHGVTLVVERAEPAH